MIRHGWKLGTKANTVLVEVLDNNLRWAQHVHENEICVRVDRLQHSTRGLIEEFLLVVIISLDPFANRVLVVERHQSGAHND